MRIIVSIFLLLFFQFSLFSTTYFVSNSGNNSNDGLTVATAFLTIQHAADLVVAGDLVLVENGTYAGFDFREVDGTAANRITFQANGNNVLINQSGPIRDDGINIENADYVTVDGFIVNNMIGNGNGVRVVLSDFAIVRNCSCDNNAERGIFTGFTDDILIEYNVCNNSVDEHGIYFSNSGDRPVIRYNECFGNNNIGIHMNGDLSAGGDGIISDAQIYGNILHDNNQAAGINMDGLENPIVYNNLIYNNHFAQGIALFQQDGAIATQGAKIFNNTILVPSDGRWGILVNTGSNINTQIYNNIILNDHSFRGSITVESTDQFMSDYNMVNDKMSVTGDGSSLPLANWQALGLGTNSFLADSPAQIFVNPNNTDFHLLNNSQAVDAGTNVVNSVVTVDLENNARPFGSAYDIGAFEYTQPLAVDILQRLKATIIGEKVQVSWQTAAEINSQHFTVFKSQDMEDWKKIMLVLAKGSPKVGFHYRIFDDKPDVGITYYKVVEQELDGNIQNLGVVSANFHDFTEISIFPNPVSNELFVQCDGKSTEISSIALFNMSGKKVQDVKVNSKKIEVSNLEKGVYLLKIILKNGREEVLEVLKN